MTFNYFTISLLLGAFTALISGFVVFIHDRKRVENQAWFALTMSTAIWSSAYFFMTIAPTREQGMLGNWILHYAAIFIPLFYYILVLVLTGTQYLHKTKVFIYVLIAFIFTSINLSPLFVYDVVQKATFQYAPVPGPLYVLFFIYFLVLVIDGLIITYKSVKVTTDKSVKARLRYTIFFTVMASLGGGSVFLTTFFGIPPYPLILFSIYPAISGYAILRYQLFDVRVVMAQVFIFSLWIFIFIRAMLSVTIEDQIVNTVLLIISIFIGTLLNRSVKKEIEQREHIEHLADDLRQANAHLTELNRQKSEFVSFATHQLRAPLTAMKGYSSLLLEGEMGELSPPQKEAVNRVFESTKTLVTIVDDYLNLSRIELGTMKYAFEPIDLQGMVEDVIAELKPNLEKSGVKFHFEVEKEKRDYRTTADRDKLKQVIANLLDNSIKYTPKGEVNVSLSYDNLAHKFVFMIKDTGIGISPEVLPHLFQKFSRAQNANKVNIKGTGLGLYVAKEIVEAHHGKIRVDSPGEGKGSTFIVELEPLAKA